MCLKEKKRLEAEERKRKRQELAEEKKRQKELKQVNLQKKGELYLAKKLMPLVFYSKRKNDKCCMKKRTE